MASNSFDNDSVGRELGRIEANQVNTDKVILEIKHELEKVRESLSSLQRAEDRRTGGVKFLMAMLTAAGMIGAVLDRLFSWLLKF